MSAPTTITLSARLKEETASQHASAEKHALMAALMRGVLPREAYAMHLGQMHGLHRGFEAMLRQTMETGYVAESLRKVVTPEQFIESHLAADCAFFGVDVASVEAMPATLRSLARLRSMQQNNPIGLLGSWYVLEGSKNGAMFISVAVKRAYGLATQDGTRSMTPYGPAQRDRWAAWKTAIDSINFTPAEQDAMVASACDMFDDVSAISTDVLAASKAAGLPEFKGLPLTAAASRD